MASRIITSHSLCLGRTIPSIWLPLIRRRSYSSTNPTSEPVDPTQILTLSTQQDMNLAKHWITQFSQLPIEACFPKDVLEITYSRSSGPGGQNVNKLSTKASIRLILSPFPSFLPPYLEPRLSNSPYKVTNGILVKNDEGRTQRGNLLAGLKRLREVLLELASEGLRGETSQSQKKRVGELIKREKVKIKREKMLKKDVKSSRRVKGGAGTWD